MHDKVNGKWMHHAIMRKSSLCLFRRWEELKDENRDEENEISMRPTLKVD